MPRLDVNPATCRAEDLAPAVAWLRDAGVVAYPTDTYYGLAVDPTSARAVDALFALKGRAADAALPLIAASLDQVQAWCRLSSSSVALARTFWPGPLSLLCEAPAAVAAAVHAGRGTVAIRVPNHGVARTLAAAWGGPVTATSANRSGAPPVSRAEALRGLDASSLLIIDGGDTPAGPPSTIVDARRDPPILVRAGAIAWDRVLHSLQR